MPLFSTNTSPKPLNAVKVSTLWHHGTTKAGDKWSPDPESFTPMTPAAQSSEHLLKDVKYQLKHLNDRKLYTISLLYTTRVCVCVCVSDAFANHVPLLRWEVKLWRDLHRLGTLAAHVFDTRRSFTDLVSLSVILFFFALWQNVFFVKSKAKDSTMLAELAHH